MHTRLRRRRVAVITHRPDDRDLGLLVICVELSVVWLSSRFRSAATRGQSKFELVHQTSTLVLPVTPPACPSFGSSATCHGGGCGGGVGENLLGPKSLLSANMLSRCRSLAPSWPFPITFLIALFKYDSSSDVLLCRSGYSGSPVSTISLECFHIFVSCLSRGLMTVFLVTDAGIF